MYFTRSEYLYCFSSSRRKACCIRTVFAIELDKFVLALSRYWITSSSNCLILLNSFRTFISFVPFDLYFLTLGGSGIFRVIRLVGTGSVRKRASGVEASSLGL